MFVQAPDEPNTREALASQSMTPAEPESGTAPPSQRCSLPRLTRPATRGRSAGTAGVARQRLWVNARKGHAVRDITTHHHLRCVIICLP